MAARSEAVSCALALGLVAAMVCYACGGGAVGPKGPEQEKRVVSAADGNEDQGRCEFKGRRDREVEETTSETAIQPNIRRVYSVVGEGEEIRRVLLCREVDTNLDGTKDVVRTYTDKGDVLHELVDSDFDGKIDTWTTFAGGRVSEAKIDRNHDGKPDEKRVYVQGRKIRAEVDSNFDGRADVWEIYEDGHLRRRGVDLDGDGHVDRWDRDLVAQRAEEEREQKEEETRQKASEAASADTAADAGVSDAAVTDARVSARNR